MKVDLDRIDRAILVALQEDARLSNKELAARVGLAPSTCSERVKRLLAGGQLRGSHADVQPEALGISLQAMVFVQLAQHSAEAMNAFRRRVSTRPEVAAVYHVAGQYDFLVQIVARDVRQLQTIVLEHLSRSGEVRHLETALIFEHTRAPSLPNYIDPDET